MLSPRARSVLAKQLDVYKRQALSCTINLAFYFAREYYTIIRELPTGKGFADICFIPRKIHLDKPAVIIELKRCV